MSNQPFAQFPILLCVVIYLLEFAINPISSAEIRKESEGVSENDLKKFVISEEEIETNLGNGDWFLNKILAFGTAITEIGNEADLSPGPIANTLFGGLIGIVREFPRFNTSYVTNEPRVQALRPQLLQKCSTAEFLLEVDFGNQIRTGQKQVEDFLYFENYKLLVEFEVNSIQEYLLPSNKSLKDIRQVAVVGAGPLPLTSIQLAAHLPHAKISNFDMSQEAVELGSIVVNSSKLTHRISYRHLSAMELTTEELVDVDVVYLAALVGHNSEEKTRIVDHLFGIMSPGSVLVARSALGLRTLVYHRIQKEDFGQFQDFREFDSKNKVIINSIALGRRPQSLLLPHDL